MKAVMLLTGNTVRMFNHSYWQVIHHTHLTVPLAKVPFNYRLFGSVQVHVYSLPLLHKLKVMQWSPPIEDWSMVDTWHEVRWTIWNHTHRYIFISLPTLNKYLNNYISNSCQFNGVDMFLVFSAFTSVLFLGEFSTCTVYVTLTALITW